MRVVALVGDLLDRSKIAAAIPATSAGAAAALPRSRFFHDPAAAIRGDE